MQCWDKMNSKIWRIKGLTNVYSWPQYMFVSSGKDMIFLRDESICSKKHLFSIHDITISTTWVHANNSNYIHHWTMARLLSRTEEEIHIFLERLTFSIEMRNTHGMSRITLENAESWCQMFDWKIASIFEHWSFSLKQPFTWNSKIFEQWTLKSLPYLVSHSLSHCEHGYLIFPKPPTHWEQKY